MFQESEGASSGDPEYPAQERLAHGAGGFACSPFAFA